jgi:hypothetical protein
VSKRVDKTQQKKSERKSSTQRIDEKIEITTRIGCPIDCVKFCPQEVLVKRYIGERNLTFKNFKLALASIPKNVLIEFSGFCEPFANPETIEMIEYAHCEGHQIALFTTLSNVDSNTVKRLIALPYKNICLHLPDGKIAKIPVTQDYMKNVFSVISGVPNIGFAVMNNLFQTNNRENIARQLATKQSPVGYCKKFKSPQFILLPNLDVQLCCMDFGLWHKLGNLHEESYNEVRNRFLKANKNFKLCSLCSQNDSSIKHMRNKVMLKLIEKL